MELYFDTVAINRAMDEMTADEFKDALKRRSISLFLGNHVIYESAKCFCNEHDISKIERGKNLFSFLSEIGDAVNIMQQENELIRSDLIRARTGGVTIRSLDALNVIAATEEMIRLSNGQFDRSNPFLKEREHKIAREAPLVREAILKANEGPQVGLTFEELRDDWPSRRQILSRSEFAGEAKDLTNHLLFSKQEKYPTINAFINCHLYLNFLVLSGQSGPSKRWLGDMRHLISASAIGVFVTADRKLENAANKIVPYLEIIKWQHFRISLQEENVS